MKRASAVLALVLVSAPAAAREPLRWHDRPSDAFHFRFGGFFPSGDDEFWAGNETTFTLNRSDFNDVAFGFSYVVGVSNHFEVGFNLDYYDATVRSAYRGFVDEAGFPIFHDSRLRVAPATVDFRLLPGGRHRLRGASGQRRVLKPVVYLGAGAGFNFWRYSETGDFLDFGVDPPEIFFDRFVESGTTFQAHALAGLELPVSPGWSVLLEGRYSWSDVTPDGDFAGLGRLDLGGTWAYLGLAVRF